MTVGGIETSAAVIAVQQSSHIDIAPSLPLPRAESRSSCGCAGLRAKIRSLLTRTTSMQQTVWVQPEPIARCPLRPEAATGALAIGAVHALLAPLAGRRSSGRNAREARRRSAERFTQSKSGNLRARVLAALDQRQRLMSHTTKTALSHSCASLAVFSFLPSFHLPLPAQQRQAELHEASISCTGRQGQSL